MRANRYRRAAGLGRRVALGCSVFAALAAAAPAPEPVAPPVRAATSLTPAQIARAAIPSIVLIRTPSGLGSGFFAGPGGKIVTNFHVIRGSTEAVVVTADKVEHKDVEVIAVDRARDLAVLRIGARGQRPLPLGDAKAAGVGERVVAIGNPLGFGDTISDGLLSGVRDFGGISILQISAPISPGSSGGPVLNDRGEVIGVSTFVVSQGQNLNFAVPIDAAKALLGGTVGKPLSAYADGSQVRHIPHHPAAILNGCPAPELHATFDAIARAIDVGAPLYNAGNFEACYRIYAGAALEVERAVKACPGPKAALAAGVANADKLSDWSAKAWAMRDAFDGLLALGQPGASGPPNRPKPALAPAALAGCTSAEREAITNAIGSAIDVGAPLYDAGNAEACFRIYAGAVAEIDRKAPGCPAARAVLNKGLEDAGQRPEIAARAWALRDAFDAVTAAIAAAKPPAAAPRKP